MHNLQQEIIDARELVDDMNPPQEICSAIKNELFCFAALADNIPGVLYSDQTGRFPVRSYAGNQYIFIAYVYDENAILMRPLKDQSDNSMVKVFREIYDYLDA